MTGWVPAGLAVGISMGSRHDDRATARQTRQWSGNVEVAGWTELVNQSRHDARRRLEDEVRRLGAEGVVVAGLQMRVRTRDCPAAVGRRDHIVDRGLAHPRMGDEDVHHRDLRHVLIEAADRTPAHEPPPDGR